MKIRGYDTSRLFREDTLLRIRHLEADIADRLKELERLSRLAREQDERLKALKRRMTHSRTKGNNTPTTMRKTILGLFRGFT